MTYLSKYDEKSNATRKQIAKELGVAGVEVQSVSFDAMYWRKSNAIHQWFVDNVQEGEDNCRQYYVSETQLQELSALCKEVIRTRNASLLPPSEGFFFGSTEADDWYWGDLQETANKLDSLLANPSALKWDFYYQSSW